MRRSIGVALERLLGIAFFLPAVLKALDMNAFVVQIAKYHVVESHAAITAIAWGTLGLEALISALLLLPTRSRWLSHGLVLAMLTAFTGLIAYAWAFHGLTDCGCFGKYLALTPAQSIAKNVAMMAVSIAALALVRGQDPPEKKPGSWAQAAAILAVLIIAVAALGSTDLSGNAPPPSTNAMSDAPFARFVYQGDGETIDLGTGAYLVAFYSAGCEHCRGSVPAVNDLALMPDLPPVVALMYGDAAEIQEFRAITSPQFPTIGIMAELGLTALEFFDFLQDPAEGANVPPRFYYIVDGVEVTHWDGEPPTMEDLIVLIDGQ